jgi:hypothetical protein
VLAIEQEIGLVTGAAIALLASAIAAQIPVISVEVVQARVISVAAAEIRTLAVMSAAAVVISAAVGRAPALWIAVAAAILVAAATMVQAARRLAAVPVRARAAAAVAGRPAWRARAGVAAERVLGVVVVVEVGDDKSPNYDLIATNRNADDQPHPVSIHAFVAEHRACTLHAWDFERVCRDTRTAHFCNRRRSRDRVGAGG